MGGVGWGGVGVERDGEIWLGQGGGAQGGEGARGAGREEV